MKFFEKFDIGFWSGLVAIGAGTAWIIAGILIQDSFYFYPLVLIVFGLWAVLKFDSKVKQKIRDKNILDDDLD